MPVCIELFLVFLKIGLFSFGGGYGMIPLIQSEVASHGYLSESELMNFIAISESTPGPIAINMATFIGSSQGGFLGAVCATVGVVLPAFVIILIIASILKNFDKNRWFNGAVAGATPVIIGLIVSTGIIMVVKSIYVNFGEFTVAPEFSYKALIIIATLFVIKYLYKLLSKKKLSAIPLILVSAVLGIIMF